MIFLWTDVQFCLPCFAQSVCPVSKMRHHLNPALHDSLPPPQKMYMHLYVLIVSTLIIALMHLRYPWQIAATMLRWGLDNCFYLEFFTLSKVICDTCGFFLMTNVLIVSRFGQKQVINVNVSHTQTGFIPSTANGHTWQKTPMEKSSIRPHLRGEKFSRINCTNNDIKNFSYWGYKCLAKGNTTRHCR